MEESVHVIFDETNTLIQEVQEDDDFEIGFMKKYDLRSTKEAEDEKPWIHLKKGKKEVHSAEELAPTPRVPHA